MPGFLAPVSAAGYGGPDLNNDGRADLGWYDPTLDAMVVRLGNGDGTYQDPLFSPGGALGSDAVWEFADINADGILDAAVSGVSYTTSEGYPIYGYVWHFEPAVHVLLGNGDGTFRSAPSVDLGKAVSFKLGDLNNDGRLDLAVLAASGLVFGIDVYLDTYLGRGDGTFARYSSTFFGTFSYPTFFDPGPLDLPLALADFNGDRAPDVLVRSDNFWESLFFGRGDGQFERPVWVDTQYGELADVNGDGKVDVLTLMSENTVGVSLGNGNGTFQPAMPYTVGSWPSAVTVGDFNGDGKADLATANDGSDDVSVLQGIGDGTFRSAQQFASGPDSYSLTAGDFDHDGWLDLIVSGSLLLNDGTWDVPPPPPPWVTIADLSVMEGSEGTLAAGFTVRLSWPPAQSVSVNWATADGSAVAGSDYVATSGTLTFAPGETEKTITVLVNGDRQYEPSETFFVNLSQPAGALIADGQAAGTIHDDEPRVWGEGVVMKEGQSRTRQFVFTVTLSAPYDLPVTVSYATADGTAKAGEDYVAASGTLTFAPGETTKTVTVLVKGDKQKEADEYFCLNLFDNIGSSLFTTSSGTGWIMNDD